MYYHPILRVSPNVIIEAMAAGAPIVATKVGAIPEMIGHKEIGENNRSGILIEPRDTDGLKRALNHLLIKPSLREAISTNAFKRVRELYSINNVFIQLQGIWEN